MYSLLSIYVCYLIRSMEIIIAAPETVTQTSPTLASLTAVSAHLKIYHSEVMVTTI